MGRRVLLNIWLAVALVALVWVVWQEPGHVPKPAAVNLTELTAAAIDKIVLTRRSGVIVLNKDKDQGAWELLEPFKIAANPLRVDDLLQLAQAESVSRFPAAGKDLAQFGLGDPVARLRLNDAELLIGSVAPLDQRRYVQFGDTIHLISDRYNFVLNSDAAAFVSRDLVPKGYNISALELPGAKLSRSEKGEWSVTSAQEISQDGLQAVVKEWRIAQAVRVAEYDGRPAQGAVVIRFQGEPPSLRYQIIARKPELILARPELGMQFYLGAGQEDRLLNFGKPATATAH